jgi:hypothetical protein
MEKTKASEVSLHRVTESEIALPEELGLESAQRHETKSIGRQLAKIEALLVALVERQQVREWYTVEEFARMVGRSEFTCREYCRHGRIKAEKRMSGRGAYASWVISHAEVQRYQREGLLPLRRFA